MTEVGCNGGLYVRGTTERRGRTIRLGSDKWVGLIVTQPCWRIMGLSTDLVTSIRPNTGFVTLPHSLRLHLGVTARYANNHKSGRTDSSVLLPQVKAAYTSPYIFFPLLCSSFLVPSGGNGLIVGVCDIIRFTETITRGY